MTATDTKADLLARLEDLQLWFARKPYGWTKTATPGQLQQYDDREREYEAILTRLEMLGE